MKICSKCNRSLPLTAFSRNRRAKDGLRSECKDCQREYHATLTSTGKQRRAQLIADGATRKCPGCQQTFLVAEFSQALAQPDTCFTYCPGCHQKQRQEYYAKPGKRARKRRADVEQSRTRRRDTKEAKARQAVQDAVKRGKLIKPDHCEGCLEPKTARELQGHHEDYDKPLEVHFFCSGCHAIADGRAVNPDPKLVQRVERVLGRILEAHMNDPTRSPQ
jgi:hypothetical protein